MCVSACVYQHDAPPGRLRKIWRRHFRAPFEVADTCQTSHLASGPGAGRLTSPFQSRHNLCRVSPPEEEAAAQKRLRSEEHTSELQSLRHLVCRLLLEKKKKRHNTLTSLRSRPAHPPREAYTPCY